MMPRDLVIRYDAEHCTLKLYTGERAADRLSLRVPSDAVPVEFACDGMLGTEALERALGKAVLSCLALSGEAPPAARPVATGGEAATVGMLPLLQLEEAAANNDPQAQYLLAIRLRASAVAQRSLFSLNRAESLLVSSANQGYPAARLLLSHWPAIRAAIHWHIERNVVSR